jgi:hypothetical protein
LIGGSTTARQNNHRNIFLFLIFQRFTLVAPYLLHFFSLVTREIKLGAARGEVSDA